MDKSKLIRYYRSWTPGRATHAKVHDWDTALIDGISRLLLALLLPHISTHITFTAQLGADPTLRVMVLNFTDPNEILDTFGI